MVMAKGLGPTLVAEFSGIDWEGPKYVDMQPTGVKLDYKKVSPFGQRPILIVDGITMSQTLAIMNVIGRKAAMMGDTDKDFAMSQMLLAETEDVYKAMQQGIPTIFNKEKTKEDYDKFWNEVAPKHLGMINALVSWGGTFTATGKTIGELYLWSMLHQVRTLRSLFHCFHATGGTRHRSEAHNAWRGMHIARAHHARGAPAKPEPERRNRRVSRQGDGARQQRPRQQRRRQARSR